MNAVKKWSPVDEVCRREGCTDPIPAQEEHVCAWDCEPDGEPVRVRLFHADCAPLGQEVKEAIGPEARYA